MSEQVYEVPAEWTRRAHVDDAKYLAMYERSIADPEAFLAIARSMPLASVIDRHCALTACGDRGWQALTARISALGATPSIPRPELASPAMIPASSVA